MPENYESLDHCVLDIMANTDAPYRVALLAAKYVFEEGWSYDSTPTPRHLVISPNFDDLKAPRIVLSMF